jgi:hypothetical protein
MYAMGTCGKFEGYVTHAHAPICVLLRAALLLLYLFWKHVPPVVPQCEGESTTSMSQCERLQLHAREGSHRVCPNAR